MILSSNTFVVSLCSVLLESGMPLCHWCILGWDSISISDFGTGDCDVGPPESIIGENLYENKTAIEICRRFAFPLSGAFEPIYTLLQSKHRAPWQLIWPRNIGLRIARCCIAKNKRSSLHRGLVAEVCITRKSSHLEPKSIINTIVTLEGRRRDKCHATVFVNGTTLLH